jgi:CubicO group peptidase (beta-lactamase class C family)
VLHGTAMVAKGGSVQLDLAEGLADVEAGVACTPGTQFQLCSVSKQFTAAAVLLLAESGISTWASQPAGGCRAARRSGSR